MAKVNFTNIEKVEKVRNNIHEEVTATYSIFSEGDATFFQIDTYGKSTRAIPEKSSQSLQIDEQSAIALIKLLNDTFNT